MDASEISDLQWAWATTAAASSVRAIFILAEGGLYPHGRESFLSGSGKKTEKHHRITGL
jgi:hypothetical protein